MKKVLISTIFVFLISMSAFSSPVSAISKLHVDRRYIKDDSGNIVYLRGVNDVCLNDAPGGFWMGQGLGWNPTGAQTELDAIKSWGANVVRWHQTIFYWTNSSGINFTNIPYDTQYKQHIHDILNWSADRGIYFIFDPYSFGCYWCGGGDQPCLPFLPYIDCDNSTNITPWVMSYMPAGWKDPSTSEDAFVEYWRQIANEYKGHPNIIFDLFNEPHGNSTVEYVWLNQTVPKIISAIRSTGADQLILVQWDYGTYVNLDFPGDYGSVNWILTAEPNINDPLNNTAYQTHIYRQYGGLGLYSLGDSISKWNSTNAWDYNEIKKTFQNELLGWVGDTIKKPLIIGETGATLGYSEPEQDHEMAGWNNSLSIFNELGLGYVGFWWRDIGVRRLLESGVPYVPPPTAPGQILIDSINPPITGKLLDENNNTVQANITVYQQGTNNVVNINQTNSTGNYRLPVSPNVYDINFNFPSISNFFIKLTSVNVFSKLQDIVSSLNYGSNSVSFNVDIKNNQTIQTYSQQKPSMVLVSGKNITEVSSLSQLTNNTWFYDSSSDILYMLANPSDFRCSDNTLYSQCSSAKPLYCDNGILTNRCSICKCPSGQNCNETTDMCYPLPPGYIFEDDFESGDTSSWTGISSYPGTTISVTSNHAYQGMYSLNTTNTYTAVGWWSNYIYKDFGANYQDLYSRLYFNVKYLPPDGKRLHLMSYYGNGSTDYGDLQFLSITNSSGTYQLSLLHRDGGILSDTTYNLASISTNIWYPVEMRRLATNPGIVSVWLNGTLVINVTGDFFDTYNGWINSTHVGMDAARNDGTDWIQQTLFDDVAVASNYIGP